MFDFSKFALVPSFWRRTGGTADSTCSKLICKDKKKRPPEHQEHPKNTPRGVKRTQEHTERPQEHRNIVSGATREHSQKPGELPRAPQEDPTRTPRSCRVIPFCAPISIHSRGRLRIYIIRLCIYDSAVVRCYQNRTDTRTSHVDPSRLRSVESRIPKYVFVSGFCWPLATGEQ